MVFIADPHHNSQKTCWNCPGARFKGNVDFQGCGQSRKVIPKNGVGQVVIECRRRPELGGFEPNITFEQCPQWRETEYGFLLKNMRVMVFGAGGYIGWPLVLRLADLGCEVHFLEAASTPAEDRAAEARNKLGWNIHLRYIDPGDTATLRDLMEEIQPEVVVHHRRVEGDQKSLDRNIPPLNHAVIDTTTLLKIMKDVVPTSSLLKLCTLDEYDCKGYPDRDGKHSIPQRDIQMEQNDKFRDTFDIRDACKSWWLRSYDITQDVVFGIHTRELDQYPELALPLESQEWQVSVVNRFVSRAVCGRPLVIHGRGDQIRSVVSLEDTVGIMVQLIASPLEPGQYRIINNLSGYHHTKKLAEMVVDVGKKHGLHVKVVTGENPREEAKRHLFQVITKSLSPEYDFDIKVPMEEEIDRMFTRLLKDKTPPSHYEESSPVDRDIIVIVSGLPRSGTSMMMEMLEKGGLKVLTDRVRGPDEDNPKGYYEYERVKSLPGNQDWLEAARGKVVKVLGELIKYMPEGLRYKVVFMERDIDEMLESQEKMLKHRGEETGDLSREEYKKIFTNYIRLLKDHINSREDMDVLFVSYNDIMSLPDTVVESISVFLGGKLDVESMLQVIDEELYRNRQF